jgi:hypothetical protein
MPAPPTGYLEIERALRLLEQGESDGWVAGRLLGVGHPSATEAVTLLRQGQRRRAHALLEVALGMLAGTPNGNGLGWFSNAGL